MIKFLGLLLIFFCFAMGGYTIAKREKERIHRAEGMLVLIRSIRQGAAFLRMPLGEIYRSFSCDALKKGEFLSTLCQKGLKEAYLSHKDEFGYDGFTEGRFLTFAESVGKLPLEEQLHACDMVSELLEEKLREAKASFPTKKKLYVTLGMTLGIGAVILLL